MTASIRCTWGSESCLLDVRVEHHELEIQCKSLCFDFVKTSQVTDVDKVENVRQCERCQERGGPGGSTGFGMNTEQ